MTKLTFGHRWKRIRISRKSVNLFTLKIYYVLDLIQLKK